MFYHSNRRKQKPGSNRHGVYLLGCLSSCGYWLWSEMLVLFSLRAPLFPWLICHTWSCFAVKFDRLLSRQWFLFLFLSLCPSFHAYSSFSLWILWLDLFNPLWLVSWVPEVISVFDDFREQTSLHKVSSVPPACSSGNLTKCPTGTCLVDLFPLDKALQNKILILFFMLLSRRFI